jgi:hypothetical protein
MSSSFSTRAKQVGSRLSLRHNGESITLRSESGTAPVKAVVEIDPAGNRESGSVLVYGQFRILEAVYIKKAVPLGLITTVTINGQDWDVFERLDAQEGLIPFNIRRRFEESEYTNLYDLSGNQAKWG